MRFLSVIFRIIKVEASVISCDWRPRLITLAKTLIILDITKTEFNYRFVIHCFMENMQKTIVCNAGIFYLWL